MADAVLVDPEDVDFLFEAIVDGKGRRHGSARLDVDEGVYVAGETVPAAGADVAPRQRYAITGDRSGDEAERAHRRAVRHRRYGRVPTAPASVKPLVGGVGIGGAALPFWLAG